MLWSRFISYVYVSLLLTLPFFVGGCSEDNTLSPEQEEVSDFNQSHSEYTGSSIQVQEGLAELFRITTRDYSYSLDTGSTVALSLEELEAFESAFDEYAAATDEALINAYELLISTEQEGVQKALAGDVSEASDAPNATELYANPSTTIGVIRQPLICGGLCIAAVAGIAGGVGAYVGLSKANEKATDAMTEPLRKKIMNANTTEKAMIAAEIDSWGNGDGEIDGNSSADEILEAYNKLNANARRQSYKKINADLDVAATEGSEVTAIDYEERQKATVKSVAGLGEDGAMLVVTNSMSATGGQGIVQVLEGLTGSAILANTVDITASFTGYQPSDFLAERLNVTVQSKAKKEVTIAKPSTTTSQIVSGGENTVPSEVSSDSEVPEILRDDKASKVEKEMAVEKIIERTEEIAGDAALNAMDNGDGTMTIEVPENTQNISIDNATGETTFPVFNFGPANITVSSENKVPEYVDEVDPSTSPTIPFAGVDLSSIGIPKADKSPEEEAPEEEVPEDEVPVEVVPVEVVPVEETPSCTTVGTMINDGSGTLHGGTTVGIKLSDLSGMNVRITVTSGTFQYVTVHARNSSGVWESVNTIREGVTSGSSIRRAVFGSSLENLTHAVLQLNGEHEKYNATACRATVEVCE